MKVAVVAFEEKRRFLRSPKLVRAEACRDVRPQCILGRLGQCEYQRALRVIYRDRYMY